MYRMYSYHQLQPSSLQFGFCSQHYSLTFHIDISLLCLYLFFFLANISSTSNTGGVGICACRDNTVRVAIGFHAKILSPSSKTVFTIRHDSHSSTWSTISTNEKISFENPRPVKVFMFDVFISVGVVSEMQLKSSST